MRPRFIPLSRLLIAALLALACASLHAHPDPGHTLDEIEDHLRETPDDQDLLRRKAELLLSTGHPAQAGPVIARLLGLGPGEPENLLLEAWHVLAAGEPEESRAKAEALAASKPDFAPGWNFLSRAEEASGNRDAAITAKRRYLEISAKPGPSEVLTCAAWLRERGKPGDAEAALAVLDAGLAKLGCLSGLQHAAIGIELPLGRHDSALRRIDALAARFRPSAELCQRRAEILEHAGRYREAASACDAALALLDALPSRRKTGAAYAARAKAIAERKRANLAKAAQ